MYQANIIDFCPNHPAVLKDVCRDGRYISIYQYYRYETYYHDINIKIFILIDAHACACHNFNILMQ